ncbi:MAG: hypothetical protein CHACPFDD_02688 [Phycisphaerae bacterium]|nr:hypothetical protein [Phycisphaerae bacterium]
MILAGVGGQGILTISRALTQAALRQGWSVKQAELHGMSQRGGAVQSHLRISDREIFSDIIPMGRADLIIAVEPLESLRYNAYLSPDSVIVASVNPMTNIAGYPPIEELLDRVARHPRHVLVDAERLARAAGAARSSNIVMLGAASLFLPFEPAQLSQAVGDLFSGKPEAAEINVRAFALGRSAASAYVDALERGATPRAARRWIGEIDPAHFADGSPPVVYAADESPALCLSGPEFRAADALLRCVQQLGRRQLFEHEVYTLMELTGAIVPPRYAFVPDGQSLSSETLAEFTGERVVLKIVSAAVVHKSDAAGVVFCTKSLDVVRREIDRLIGLHAAAGVAGVLMVEFVEGARGGFSGLGSELFVGIRATREFGPVIAAGLGGVDTEYLASRMRPGVAVAKAIVATTSAEQFLELFRQTAAYDILGGRARGHRRAVSDGELLRCFRAFLSLARAFCRPRDDGGPTLVELEVNPFAFRRLRMVPLDGRGRLGPVRSPEAPRPVENVERMLQPRSIAVLGVSANTINFGRIIVRNIKSCGFPVAHTYIIKKDEREIDGVRCVPSCAELPEPADLLVVATAAATLPVALDDIVASRKVRSAIMIPGGVGETDGTQELEARIESIIRRAGATAASPVERTVFLGPNSLGIQSRCGKYDTFFVPAAKLAVRRGSAPQRAALISQSGAFIVGRLSNLESIDPMLAVSVGNQLDLTLSDLLRAVGRRDDVDVVGVYAEGFADLDGEPFLRAIQDLSESGKIVIFYKAGRTEAGRSAAAGHTASVAGDYDVCQAAAAQAGALVVDTFKEFEQVFDLAIKLHNLPAPGLRLAAITNAGCESVAMADAIRGSRYEIETPPLSPALTTRLTSILSRHGLDKLVNPRNPLDLTSGAPEAAYEECTRLLLESDEIDAVVVSAVPLTPSLRTTPDEIVQPGSLATRLPALFATARKPLVAVIDAGSLYDVLARRIHDAGVPLFRTCDQAVRSLGRYLCHRVQFAPRSTAPSAVPLPDTDERPMLVAAESQAG